MLITRRTVAAALLAFLMSTPQVRASASGEAIGADVSISTYQHYLEDLLYTFLGDNRGFGPQHDLARDNIELTLQSFGLTVELEPFQYSGNTYHNIVATQLGHDDPDQIIVVGAHFDSVNNPGADDNGTGTALVMEAARVLSAHRSAKTIKYVLFDREEQGLRGSSAFVAAHSNENIIMAVTADMVGHDSGFFGMDIYGRVDSAAAVNGMADAIGTYGDGLNDFVNLGNFAISDHWSFEIAGIPAFVIIERCYQCNANYHTQNDAVNIAPDYITYPMVEKLVGSVVGYLVDEVGVTIYGDLNDDGQVTTTDLLGMLAAWGPCEGCLADTNGDGLVNITDLLALLANWG